ncbi:MAG TPA: hypothetical protein VG435_13660 [Acidimicrobiales bacterium]|jgi:hypothetical protein|nr:hypothetical protein [Acidimicrobiales bacterium]
MQSWMKRAAAAAGALSATAWMTGGLVLPAVAASGHPTGSVTNPYSPAYGHSYRRGVVPTRGQQQKMAKYASGQSTGPKTLSYGGGIDGIGVTSGTPRIYLVFWGSQWGTQGTDGNGNATFSNDPAGGAPYVQQLFKGIGTGGELWSGTMTQYCDGSVAAGATTCPAGAAHVGYPTGGALAGVWYDNSAATPAAASGEQIAAEAVAAAGHFGNTTPAANRDVQYDILSPTGADPDNYETGGFCAWHDYNGDSTLSGGAAPSSYGDIAFTNMPYVPDAGASCGAGFVNRGSNVDGYSIVNGHEYAETITDQNPAGGWTNHQNNSYGGEENADECAWISSGTGAAADVKMADGSFAMQSTWSNDTNACAISHTIVGGTTTTTNAVTNGGFEAGNLSGWSHTGTTGVVTNPVHSGTYAAEAGTTARTNGTSSVAQTFTAATGNSQLTFWYDNVCGSNVRSDWATATLTDNTTSRSTTALAKTCSSNSGWRQVTVAVTAGHSYTLTLANYDSRNTAYTAFDDVSTS